MAAAPHVTANHRVAASAAATSMPSTREMNTEDAGAGELSAVTECRGACCGTRPPTRCAICEVRPEHASRASIWENWHLACYDSVMSESTRPSEVFPGRLRAAREKRGLNQGELASRAGLQASAISHFETATRKPSFDNLRRLADALDVTTDYLLGRVTDSQVLAGADKLYRDLDRLTANDRDIAKDFLEMLADKAGDRGNKERR